MAGSTFEELAATKLKVRESTTFHHPVSFFYDRKLLQPQCLVGITLRKPTSFFLSAYYWCRGKNCKRHFEGCGFLSCVHGSPLDKQYNDYKSKLTIEEYVQRQAEWQVGRNIVTRILGSPIGTSGPDATRKEFTKIIANHTAAGTTYFNTAVQRLLAFDFVIIYEHIDDSYNKIFGVEQTPHDNPARTNHSTDLSPDLTAQVDALYELDNLIYDLALEQYRDFKPFNLVYKPFPAKSKAPTCLAPDRSAAPLLQLK